MLLLGIYIYQVDFNILWEKISILKWKVVLLFLVPGIGYVLATWAWKLCFQQQKHGLNLYLLFIIRHIGESLAIINPTNFVAGETAKVFLLQKAGIDYTAGVSSVLLSRTILMASHIFLMILILAMLPFFMEIEMSVHWIFTGFFCLLSFCGLMFYALTSPRLWLYQGVVKLAQKFDRLQPFAKKIKTINLEMSRFYQDNKRKLFVAFLLSISHWCIGALEFYLIIKCLGYDLSFLTALILETGVMLIKSAGSFVPGQLGVEEYGNLLMLNFMQLNDPALWLGVSLLRRGRQVFWLLIGVGMSIMVKKFLSRQSPVILE